MEKKDDQTQLYYYYFFFTSSVCLSECINVRNEGTFFQQTSTNWCIKNNWEYLCMRTWNSVRENERVILRLSVIVKIGASERASDGRFGNNDSRNEWMDEWMCATVMACLFSYCLLLLVSRCMHTHKSFLSRAAWPTSQQHVHSTTPCSLTHIIKTSGIFWYGNVLKRSVCKLRVMWYIVLIVCRKRWHVSQYVS